MGAGILCPPAMHGRTKPPHAQAYRGAGAYRRVKLAIVFVSSAARSFLSSNILPHAPGRFNVIKCKIPPFLAAPHTKSALAAAGALLTLNASLEFRRARRCVRRKKHRSPGQCGILTPRVKIMRAAGCNFFQTRTQQSGSRLMLFNLRTGCYTISRRSSRSPAAPRACPAR